MPKWVSFNGMLSNALRRIVRRNGGEFHGSFWQVAEALQLEVGGIVCEEDVEPMKSHILNIGCEALVEGTDLVFFKMNDPRAPLNFVEKELFYDA